MKKSKKLIALGLAAAMALAPATVFADAVTKEATTSPISETFNVGNKNAPQLDTEVFDVELPTQAYAEKVLFFFLDPHELIASTQGVALSQGGAGTMTGGADKRVLFRNYNATGSAVTGLSNRSDALIVKNKGTAQVDVRADVTVVPGGNVKIVTPDAAVASGKAANLQIKLHTATASTAANGTGGISSSTTAGKTEPIAMKPSWTDDEGVVHKRTEAKAILDVSAKAIAADKFEVSHQGASAYESASGDAAQGYTYSLAAANVKMSEDVGFWFTATCNPNANWNTTDTVTMNVAWTLEKHIKYDTGKAEKNGENIFLYQNAAGANFDKDVTVNEVKVRLWFADKTYTDISTWVFRIDEENGNKLTCAQGEVLTEGFTGEGVTHDGESGVHYTKAEFFYKVDGIWYTATITNP